MVIIIVLSNTILKSNITWNKMKSKIIYIY